MWTHASGVQAYIRGQRPKPHGYRCPCINFILHINKDRKELLLKIELRKIFNFPQVTGKIFQMIIIILIVFNYYTPKMIINIMILLSD